MKDIPNIFIDLSSPQRRRKTRGDGDVVLIKGGNCETEIRRRMAKDAFQKRDRV